MRLLLAFCFCLTAVPAVAQDAASLGREAVAAVLDHYTLNPLASVPATHQPLPPTGTWSVRTTRPDGCPHDATPCARVIYSVPVDHVECEWTVVPQQGAAPATFLDQNEDATRYVIRKVSASEMAPLVMSDPQPVYPAIARAAHVDGTVVVRFVVSADGVVTTAAPVSGPAMLLRSAMDTAKQWTFHPLHVGGQSVPFVADVHAVFTIEGKHRTDCTKDNPCYESSLPKVSTSMHP